MPLEILGFWTRETISNIRRNRLMSVLAVSTATIGLFVLGAFYLAWASLQSTVDTQTKKLDLRVILQRDVTSQRRKQIYEAIHRLPQIADLEFVSKAQVLKEMHKEMRDLPVEDLIKDNPLGDELHIKLKNPEDIFEVRARINALQGVQKIRTPAEDEVVRQLLAVNNFVKVAGFVALVVLGLGILLIIHNAIRMTIFARRREIRIMELVGATPWFIRIPFLMEGLVYGVTGAAYAAIVLSMLFVMVTRNPTTIVHILLPAAPFGLLVKCVIWIMLTGIAFGLAGSWVSLSRSIGKAGQI